MLNSSEEFVSNSDLPNPHLPALRAVGEENFGFRESGFWRRRFSREQTQP
jgi:hypothetical protein